MAKSFQLDDDGDNDNLLTAILLVVVLLMGLVNFFIHFRPVVFYPGPLFAFLLTRWSYKRHFRKQLESLSPELLESDEADVT